ncbi:MarR family winged helix-turn-helix transcriptional regulator [Shouchella miscanthi]|uniref:MarR family transcriptional regulator n=1 Tax=Shouchella miscanthi TaxID=2598861 RepID=A0ABU6NFS7_9BACI|nr:MarR family transcriptional regulator [Shouchella miscanthi]MED4126639.1 MarR family transcriptional regulator [Shouchella miscanthi]
MKETDQDSLKLFTVLSRAMQTVKSHVETDIRKHGFNPTEFAVLELLYSKGDQTVQKIGQKVLIASSSITYVVDKLEKKAMIVRKPSPTDRRVTYVSITQKGINWMDAVFPQHAQALSSIFSPLNEQEKKAMITYLKRVGLQENRISD